jgi:2,5-furandicarboxylate decarboxylase 1
MSLRSFVEELQRIDRLTIVNTEVDPNLELAGVIFALQARPVLFPHVKREGFRVVSGICGDRDLFALALGVNRTDLVRILARALDRPKAPDVVEGPEQPACHEVVEPDVDLNRLPILTHTTLDGGPYVTTGIVVVRDEEFGLNVSFHRLMQIGPRRFTGRIIEGSGLHTAFGKSTGDLPIAICIGNSLPVLLAAAMSPAKGVNELHLANALQPSPVTRCLGSDLLVPAETEIVLEGRLIHEFVDEGRFIDLTGTLDYVRRQPIFEIDRITHRQAPIFHALLPGGAEHKLLMGMPREPTIYTEASRQCDCRNVYVTPGGTSWLHAVVQIEKHHPDDGQRAIQAAFRGHTSLKHVVVVDTDVDPFDAADVEWAIATRFQADRDLVVLRDQPSSSLDPSASHVPGAKTRTSKMGLDATVPWTARDGSLLSLEERASFQRVGYQPIDLRKYL